MTTWVKPNGTKIELNDERATVAHAQDLGWQVDAPAKKAPTKKPATKKRAPAKKVES